MSKIVFKTRESIKDIINNAALKAMENGSLPQTELPSFNVEVPSDRSHGDFAVNAAMVWARALRLVLRCLFRISLLRLLPASAM